MDEFFRILKEKRKERYTQEAFAKALGVTDTQVQNHEKDTLPPHDKLIKINSLLDYDFSRHIYQEKFGNEEGPGRLMYNEMILLVEKYRASFGEPQKTTQSPPLIQGGSKRKVSRFDQTSVDKSKVQGRQSGQDSTNSAGKSSKG